MMTPEQYRESLRDGRGTYLDGRRVTDVTEEPLLRAAIDWVADGYARFYSPEPDAVHPMWEAPQTVEDLRSRIEMLMQSDITAALSAVVLALLTVAPELERSNPEYKRRIFAFANYCCRADLRVAEAISDAKGDRSLSPSQQVDPDMYLHVVERQRDGIVVSGCKMHITAASLVHEMVVLPTKQMKRGEEAYAVAFSVPLNTPGLSVINTTYAPRNEDARHFPLSRRHNMPEGFVIFDRVFVPSERVFLDGEVEHSGKLAHALGLWERIGAVAAAARQGDLLVGMAQLIAEANGLDKVPHIRDKINEMIMYATLIRAGLEAALSNATINADGMVQPDELYTNAAKYYQAANYHLMVRNLQDIAGALVITGPTIADLQNPEVGDKVHKYMRARADISGETRLRLFHLIRDTTADAFGGWELVTKMMSGGGMYAQRLVTRLHYDMEAAKALAREAAGIRAEETQAQPARKTRMAG